MATRAEIQAKLEKIDQRKAEAIKALQARRSKLKAKLAQLDRPTKSQRRLDARRKILLGAFVLDQLQHAGIAPQELTFEGKRFFDWLIRPNDRAVFEELASGTAAPGNPSPSPRVATTDIPLNVPFTDKDQAKSLGAHWHPDKKRWVVPAGLDLDPFKAWLD